MATKALSQQQRSSAIHTYTTMYIRTDRHTQTKRKHIVIEKAVIKLLVLDMKVNAAGAGGGWRWGVVR